MKPVRRPNETKSRAKQRSSAQLTTTEVSRQPFDVHAEARRQVDADLSEINRNLENYTAKGLKSIEIICAEIRQRILLLDLVAVDNGSFAQAIKQVVPNAERKAVDSLCSTAKQLNSCLIRIAQTNNAFAADFVWDNGVDMVSAIKSLAQTKPDLLKPKARKAIYMPSFRARPKKFTDDFFVTADAIELSKDFPIKTGDEAAYDLDSLVTQFLIKMLADAEFKRTLLLRIARFSNRNQASANRPSSFPREQGLLKLLGIGPEHLKYLNLAPYSKETAESWWEKCIKPQLDSPEILQQMEGTKLHGLLSRAAKSTKAYGIRDQLNKLCRPKVLQSLAPEQPPLEAGLPVK